MNPVELNERSYISISEFRVTQGINVFIKYQKYKIIIV